MAGPIAAAMRSGFAPSFRMASTVASMMPPSAPFQPACAAPITRAVPSQSSTGAQSAVSTPMASPGVLVTMASASGGVSPFHGASAITASALCFWNTVMSLPGSAPSSSATRARFSTTLAACVARARPAIERGIDAARDAALAREESMPDPGERGEAGRAKLHFVWCDHGVRNRKVKCLRREAAGQARSIAARAS